MNWPSELSTVLNDFLGSLIKNLTDRLVPWVFRGFRPDSASSSINEPDSVEFDTENPSYLLYKICFDLNIVLTNYSIVDNISNELSSCEELMTRLKHKRARIYVFGHQNAGKSTFVNLLSGMRKGSPENIDRCTACLVYIRYGKETRVVVHRSNGMTQLIDPREFWESMPAWAKAEDDSRPYKAEVFTRQPILGSVENEVVDTPGSGSEDSGKGGRIDDVLIREAGQKAVIAVLIYRQGSKDSDAHRRYLKELSQLNNGVQKRVAIFAICNIDANYQEDFATKKDQLRKSIQHAENEIGGSLEATCFRINLRLAEVSAEKKAQVDGSSSFRDLLKSMQVALQDRTRIAIHQGVPELRSIIALSQVKLHLKIGKVDLKCEELEQLRKSRDNRLAEVRQAYENKIKIQKSFSKTGLGAALGGLFGGALDIMTALLSVGTLATIGAGIGSRLGASLAEADIERAKQLITQQWSFTQAEFQRCTWIDSDQRKEIETSWEQLDDKGLFLSVLSRLEKENSTSVSKSSEYRSREMCKKTTQQLSDLKNTLDEFQIKHM